MKKSPAAITNTLNRLWQSAALALLGVAAVALLVYSLVPDPPEAAVEQYKLWFLEHWRYMVKPEPKEQNAYLWTTLLVPWLAYLSVRAPKSGKKLLDLLALGWLGLSVWLIFGNPDFVSVAFRKMGENIVLAGKIMLAALAIAAVLRCWRRPCFDRRWVLAVFLPAGLLMTMTSTLYVLSNIGDYFLFHFDPVLYAVSQTSRGMHFVHQYGFYPEFLSPVFQLFPATVRNVNLVLSVLTFFSFGCVLFAAYKMIRNPLVFVVSSFVLLMFCTMGWGMVNGNRFDPYFQYYPIRTVFPSLSLALAAIYCVRAPGYFHLTAGLLMGMGLFWNFDVGVVGAGAFLFLFGAETWFEPRQKWRTLVGYSAAAAISAVICWGWLSCINQQLLTPGILFQMQKASVTAGYFMMPMAHLPYFWGMLAATYVTGIVWGIYALSRHDRDPGARWVMFASVVGLGLFGYFAGRSHVNNLMHVCYPALLIFAVYLDRATRLCRQKKLRLTALALAFPGIFFAAGSLYCTVSRLPHLKAAFVYNAQGSLWDEPGPMHIDAQFIRDRSAGRRVNIFGILQGYFYAQSGTRSAIVGSDEVEMLLLPDYERITGEIVKADAPLFLSRLNGSWSIRLDEEMINRRYELKEVSPTRLVRYYEPRKP